MRRLALVLGLLVAVLWTGIAAATGADAGDAAVVAHGASAEPRTQGGSATPFSLRLPDGAACPGDSADDGYRVQGFLLPEAVDPAGVRYRSIGPADAGYALYDEFSRPFVQVQTAKAEEDGGPGLILDLPTLDLAVFPRGELRPGRWRVGVACTLTNETVRFWDAQLRITEDRADEPAGLRWRVLGADATSGGGTPALLPIAGIGAVVVGAVVVVRRRTPRPERAR